MKKFVFLIRNILIGDFQARENEIGIMEDESSNSIYFPFTDTVVPIERKDFEFFDHTKVGDRFSKKVCNVCQRLLDTENFQLNQTAKGDRPVRRPSCKNCRKVIDGVKIPSREKRKWELNKPKGDRFKCPICQKVTIPSLTSVVVLDHDHSTGKVRGWICESCNTGIGRFKDDIDLLEKAIIFVKTN